MTTARDITNVPNATTYDVIGEVNAALEQTKGFEGLKTKTERLMLAASSKYVEAFLRWQDDILIGCIGLADIFDPNVIVLSGSMAQFVDVEYVESELNKEIVTTYTEVKLASAGNYSGMIGAALLAMGVGL